MTQELFNQALAALQRGNLVEAEQLCQLLVKGEPRNFNALNLLAMTRFQGGRPGEAVRTMQKALEINSGFAPAWSNFAAMQAAAGMAEAALASFERALAIAPPQAQSLVNHANLLCSLGRDGEAAERFTQALALNPGQVEALIGRATAWEHLGRHGEALADCDRALALAPQSPQALNNRALALAGLGRLDEALQSAGRVVAAQPRRPNTHNSRASILLAMKRYPEALESCDQALALDPRLAPALCNRGAALQGLGRPDEAMAAFEAALSADPALPQGHANKGGALRQRARYTAALASFDRALALAPGNVEALCHRAVVLAQLGRTEDALAGFDAAIALAPQAADPRFNKSQVLLLNGRYEEGLPLYEWRKRLNPPMGQRVFAQPLWDGEADIAGKTLFLYWEQGLGDTLMLSRYAAPLAAMGARLVLAVPDTLVALYRGFVPEAEIIGGGAVPAAFDTHAPLGSLPLALKTRPDNIPAPVPYLRPEPERVESWRARLGQHGFKIGIAWQGAKGNSDIGRSFPLALFETIAAVPNVRLISLQKGEGAEQVADCGFAVENLGPDFDAGPDGFLDTASVMQSCDLVISSDTATAHLAGALGRPLWIALQHVPEWRWLLERGDSPWYPTATLFRQAAPGDWASVFAAMVTQLQHGETQKPH